MVVIECTSCVRPYTMKFSELGLVIYFCPRCGTVDRVQRQSRQHPSAAIPAVRISLDLRTAVPVTLK